jgi:beta-N-acetylhexosaminidase
VSTPPDADRLGQRMLRTFEGLEPTAEVLAAIGAGRAAGVTLFRARNIATPGKVRALTAALQAARPTGAPPLIIAADQEGVQLQAIGHEATAWPGNLALAATGSTALARRCGEAIGLELAAMGVTVAFAPVCDLLGAPGSAVLGTRTFGDDPVLAGRLSAAMVYGIQARGVAATLKHFPGHGSVAGDSHHGLPVATVDGATVRTRELAPFRAGIRAGARLVMLGHLAVPAVTGGRVLAATLAPEIAVDLLRGELGFAGVSVTDALDMGALGAIADLPEIVSQSARAGVDLMLANHPFELEEQALGRLAADAQGGSLDATAVRRSRRRIDALRRWLGRAPAQPGLDVVASAAHVALAREIAERAVTLVRDRAALLPMRPPSDGPWRIAVLAPRPVDLTPADTSSYAGMGLADALRDALESAGQAASVEAFEAPLDPDPEAIAELRRSAAEATVTIVGTVDALVHPAQARLAEALVDGGNPVVAVALRTPFDILAYPAVDTYACSYGIQPPNLRAVADALLGHIPFRGRLPVRLDQG